MILVEYLIPWDFSSGGSFIFLEISFVLGGGVVRSQIEEPKKKKKKVVRLFRSTRLK